MLSHIIPVICENVRLKFFIFLFLREGKFAYKPNRIFVRLATNEQGLALDFIFITRLKGIVIPHPTFLGINI